MNIYLPKKEEDLDFRFFFDISKTMFTKLCRKFTTENSL